MSKKKSGGWRLLSEKSPYLLQHANNPVEWFPWSLEAFKKAKQENKPIFLSIGYSTCHWCHVMAKESFENIEIAKILNDNFVSIKIDREERPDIDMLYMRYVQAISGNGGWPASLWLTPHLKPFFAGTYFPTEDKWGKIGFKTLLLRIAELWNKDKDQILSSAEEIAAKIANTTLYISDTIENPFLIIHQCFRNIRANFDHLHGGFSPAPKFPRPITFNFLLKYYLFTRDSNALDMIIFSLKKIAEGGIHDQLAGGFHRYSTDEKWLLPHFEKMLYDQALMANALLDSAKIANDDYLAKIAKNTLDYISSCLLGHESQFFSAEDADSPEPENPQSHSEGAFYLWSYDEIKKIISDEQNFRIFNYHFGILPDGNIDTDQFGELKNKNILYIAHSLKETADFFKIPESQIADIIGKSKQKLFEAKLKRPRPYLDDKAICSSNSLAISAFTKAYLVLNDQSYLDIAENAAKFILNKLYDKKNKTLLRRYRENNSAIQGLLEDYAFFIKALLDLNQCVFKEYYLIKALELQEIQDELFFDNRTQQYLCAPANDDTLIQRPVEDFEGAEPAGNSIAIKNLMRISQLTANESFRSRAEQIAQAFCAKLKNFPEAMPELFSSALELNSDPITVTVYGNISEQDLNKLAKNFNPTLNSNKIIIAVGKSPNLIKINKTLRISQYESPLIQICKANTCLPPVNSIEEALKLI